MPLDILFPAMTLAGWTFVVLLIIPVARFRAVGKGEATREDFALGESQRVPDYVRLPNRNYMNLLEMPVIFYAVVLIAFLSGQADKVSLALAWTYVALRVIHSLVHLTANHVPVRLSLFAASNIAMIALWGWVLAAMLEARAFAG